MSLNTAHANGGVLIYNGEIILLYCDGVEMSFEGGDAKDFGGTKKGRIYLTTHRMIFLNKSEKDRLQSFSFPFFSLSKVELEQPVFGANFIKGLVNSQPGGNWTGKAVFKLKFFSGGAIEFGKAMLKTAHIASQYMPPQPPPYIPHQGPYYPAPPPAYAPPSDGINGFIPPTHVFPDAPPANSVYTTDMPPPYPGINPGYSYPQAAMPLPQYGMNGQVIQQPYGYSGMPPQPGFYNPAMGAAASAPPAYDSAMQVPYGATAQHNGSNQQPPSVDSKSEYPFPADYYQDPFLQQNYSLPQYMQNQNMNGQTNLGPPPPYAPSNVKKEQ